MYYKNKNIYLHSNKMTKVFFDIVIGNKSGN